MPKKQPLKPPARPMALQPKQSQRSQSLPIAKAFFYLLVCISMGFSVLYLRRSLNLDVLAVDLHVPLPTQAQSWKGRPRHFETGKEIVERAYRETYRHIVEQCGPEKNVNGMYSLMWCLKEMHANTNTTYRKLKISLLVHFHSLDIWPLTFLKTLPLTYTVFSMVV